MMRELSERELEVTRLVAKGYSNLEIAEQLDLVEGTVKIHVHHAMVKIGVRNRTELTLYALGRRIKPRR